MGIDISSTAVKIAHKSAEKHGMHTFFIVCDATKLPFRSQTFGVAICSEVLEHLIWPDKAQVIEETSRVTKRYGSFIITTPNPRSLVLLLKNIVTKMRHLRSDIRPFQKISSQPIEE